MNTQTAERASVGEIMTPEAGNEADRRRISKVADAIHRDIATGVEVSSRAGGMNFVDYGQVMEFAKLMSMAAGAVPEHCRGNPGVCLAIVTQAVEWRMSPFAVANKSYFVNDRVAYESQMIHAVIEARAPLQGRLRCEYLGEGDGRRCKVTGWLKGEQEPFVFVSETLAKLRPAKNSEGVRKGSPLWDKKPDVQLWYNASRDWARMFCPDVILGIYSEDELDEVLISRASQEPQASPRLLDRLPGKMEGAGFDPDAVKNGTAEAPAGPAGVAETQQPQEASQEPQGGAQAAPAAPEGKDTDQGESAQGGEDGGQPAGGKRRSKTKSAAKPEEESAPVAEPKTVAEYVTYAEAWIDDLEDGNAGAKRWKDEIKLRNACNLLEDDRTALKGKLDAKIATLKG